MAGESGVVDVAAVRLAYPALSDGWAYIAGGTDALVPGSVAAAMGAAASAAGTISSDGSAGAHSRDKGVRVRVDEATRVAARRAIGRLVGVSDPGRVITGPSPAAIVRMLCHATSHLLRAGDNVVISAADPWYLTGPISGTAAAVGASTRQVLPDLGSGQVPEWQFADVIDGNTRLVALAAGHAATGNCVDVARVVDIVRDRSRAWVIVDATAVAGTRPIDADAWGANVIIVDMGVLGGPPIAAAIIKTTGMLERMTPLNAEAIIRTRAAHTPATPHLPGGFTDLTSPDNDRSFSEATSSDPNPAQKPAGSGDSVGDAGVGFAHSSKGLTVTDFEDQPPHTMHAAGAVAFVDHLTSIAGNIPGRASHKLATALTYIDDHTTALTAEFFEHAATIPGVHIVGVTGEAAEAGRHHTDRIPGFAVMVENYPAAAVAAALSRQRIATTIAPPDPLLRAMGVDDAGGATLIRPAAYTSQDDMGRLVEALAAISATTP